MNKDLPRWVQVAIVLVIAVVALLVFSSQDRIHVYGTYLREKSPHITTNLPALSVEMDEAMLRKHFDGVPLNCIGQGPGSDTLGDRVCYASIDQADGVDAGRILPQGQAGACDRADALVGAPVLEESFDGAVWAAVPCRSSIALWWSGAALGHAQRLRRNQPRPQFQPTELERDHLDWQEDPVAAR